MRKDYYKIVFILLVICFLGYNSQAQVARSITKDYKVKKEQCKSYINELSDYLISKGLYPGLEHKEDIVGSLQQVKNKLTIGGTNFLKDYDFVIEILGFDDGVIEEMIHCGDFGIIEIGFSSKEKAIEVFNKANETSTKYPMNIFLYVPPFRCVQVGNNVLFVYSINFHYDKFRNMAKDWKPGMK